MTVPLIFWTLVGLVPIPFWNLLLHGLTATRRLGTALLSLPRPI